LPTEKTLNMLRAVSLLKVSLLLASLLSCAAATALELKANDAEPDPLDALEISLVVLDPGIERDSSRDRQQGIYPEIREAEASYLPYALRRTLVDSNHWGAVRVLPEPEASAEVLITGRIVRSDGIELTLAMTAKDSRGQLWFEREFTVTAADDAYQATARRTRRPFQDLYNEVANELLTARQKLTAKELETIRRIAKLRYAVNLAPTAFGSFLSVDAQGQYQLLRLPANDDPMMARIDRIREQEYLFIDTTDEQYAELYTEMTPVYDLWRQFQREQVVYRTAYEARLADREKPKSGSYQGLKRSYYNYRWAKLQRQEMKLLAEGFNNEVAPTSLVVEGTVVNLSGSLDERYREWQRLLREIFALETGT
jgi:hypothetical protein